MTLHRAVIVGASHAGAQLAASLRQEGWDGEIVLVGRLEQHIGGASGAEPGDLVHGGVGREAATHAGDPVTQLREQIVAEVHAGVPPRSFGSW